MVVLWVDIRPRIQKDCLSRGSHLQMPAVGLRHIRGTFPSSFPQPHMRKRTWVVFLSLCIHVADCMWTICLICLYGTVNKVLNAEGLNDDFIDLLLREINSLGENLFVFWAVIGKSPSIFCPQFYIICATVSSVQNLLYYLCLGILHWSLVYFTLFWYKLLQCRNREDQLMILMFVFIKCLLLLTLHSK